MNVFQGWVDRLLKRDAKRPATLPPLLFAPTPVPPPPASLTQDTRRQEALHVLRNAHSAADWRRLSRDRNGFVREAAVRQLMQIDDSEALTCLIERLNDFVPQVRELADQGVRRFLAPRYALILTEVLDLFMALEHRSRTDHRAMLGTVIDILSLPLIRDTTLQAFLQARGPAARLMLDILQRAFAEDVQGVLARAQAHSDPSVQRLALQACLTLPEEYARPLIAAALGSRAANLRLNALRAWLSLSNSPEHVHPLLENAVLDPSASVRSLARFVAPQWQVNCHEVLQQRLTRPAPTRQREWIGLIGLIRELKSPQPTTLLLATHHAAPGVRSMALETLEQLCGDASLDPLICALNDPAPRVFRMAVHLLGKQSSAAVDESVSQLLRNSALAQEHRRALVSIKASWQQLAYWMQGWREAGNDADQWLAEVNRWCETRHQTSDYTTPRALRLELLDELTELESQGLVAGGTAASLR